MYFSPQVFNVKRTVQISQGEKRNSFDAKGSSSDVRHMAREIGLRVENQLSNN